MDSLQLQIVGWLVTNPPPAFFSSVASRWRRVSRLTTSLRFMGFSSVGSNTTDADGVKERAARGAASAATDVAGAAEADDGRCVAARGTLQALVHEVAEGPAV